MKQTGKKALRRTNTGIEGYFCGMEGLISITPYKELLFGEKSIYDFIKKDKKIDVDVIKYLKTENAYLMSPGIYPHPFKPEMQLLGPYIYTDGTYCWDRDTWKYAVKYGLEIPDFFIEHVNSKAGKQFFDDYVKNHNLTWKKIISDGKSASGNSLVLLPDDTGDIDLDNF